MAQGSIVKRCPICGNQSSTPCTHKEARYAIVYRVGKKQKWESGWATRHAAERRLSEIMSELHTGTYREPKPILFSEFALKWLKDYAAGATKPATFETYRIIIEHRLNSAFGNRPLLNLTAEEIQGLVSTSLRDKNLAPKTVNNTLVLLKTMLMHGVRWGYLRENPAQYIDPLRVEPKEMSFLTPEEIRLLLENSHEPFRTLFTTAILTGMRRGELLGLQWGDIDWNQNRIYIKRSIYWRVRKDIKSNEPCWIFVTPKSARSRRTVVMSPRLREALEFHKSISIANSHDLVFCNKHGAPLDPDNMIHWQFFPALRRAGLRRIRFHDLRHTYTALLISQGENIKFIQSQLGHASATTTLDRYGHLMPDSHRETGQRLDQQVFALIPAPRPV